MWKLSSVIGKQKEKWDVAVGMLLMDVLKGEQDVKNVSTLHEIERE